MPEYYDPVRHLGPQANHQKLYDFERDVLRVKNPLNQDFTFHYDMLPRVVPANGTQDWERYLVRRYIWNMIGYIYNLFAAKKMASSVEAFRRTHPDVVDDPYLLNEQIYLKMKRSDDPEFQQKVIQDCVVCLVSKFGSNRVLPKRPTGGEIDPNTPLYDKLIDDFKTVGVDPLADLRKTTADHQEMLKTAPIPAAPTGLQRQNPANQGAEQSPLDPTAELNVNDITI